MSSTRSAAVLTLQSIKSHSSEKLQVNKMWIWIYKHLINTKMITGIELGDSLMLQTKCMWLAATCWIQKVMLPVSHHVQNSSKCWGYYSTQHPHMQKNSQTLKKVLRWVCNWLSFPMQLPKLAMEFRSSFQTYNLHGDTISMEKPV